MMVDLVSTLGLTNGRRCLTGFRPLRARNRWPQLATLSVRFTNPHHKQPKPLWLVEKIFSGDLAIARMENWGVWILQSDCHLIISIVESPSFLSVILLMFLCDGHGLCDSDDDWSSSGNIGNLARNKRWMCGLVVWVILHQLHWRSRPNMTDLKCC